MKRRSCLSFLVFVLFLMPAFLPAQTAAQCENTKRTYADFQGSYLDGVSVLSIPLLYGKVTDANNAVNGQVKDASTLGFSVSLLGLSSATQFLQFTKNGVPRTFPANTPVTIKISLPKEVAGLIGGVEIGSFTGLHPVTEDWGVLTGHMAGYDATSKTKIYDGTALLGVLSGAGETKPGQEFNGVYIKISSVLSLGMTAKVFHAYIMEPTLDIDCDEAIDVLTGVKPTIIGGVANFLGSVTDPFYAIDGDIQSPALMDAGLNVLSKVYLTAIFQKPSQKGDFVTIVFENPGGALLNLGLLNGFVIQPYLGDDPAVPAFEKSNNFLNLSLFPGPGNTQVMTFPVNEKYDRIEIIMGGAADLLGKLKIYDIKRKLATPRVVIDPVTTDRRTICEGEQTTFSIDNPQECTDYKWYSVETGGTAVASGLTFSPPTNLIAGEYNYYVEASRTYCVSAVSERLKVKLIVNPAPPLSIDGVNICSGATALFIINNAEVAKYTYNWYSTSTGVVPVNTGATYSPVLNVTTSYYLEATNIVTGCKNLGGRQQVTATVKQYAPVAAIVGPSEMCRRTATTFTNTYPNGIWSTSDATIATVDATGKVTAVAAGNVMISYSVADDATYCDKKVDFNLTVNPQPNITLEPDPDICEGLTTTKIIYTDPLFDPITYSITWATGPILNVSDQTLPAKEITINVPPNTPVAVYQGTLTIKNANGCLRAIPFSFRVKLVPHKPIVSIN